MFTEKIYKIFRDVPNLFGIADYIPIVKYDVDGRDHNRTLRQVMQIGHQNFNINKNKCYIRCMRVPFFEEVISREAVQPDPKKLCVQNKMPPIKIIFR